MPYKAVGNWVYKMKNGRWVRFKKHDNHEAAQAHAAALRINVKHEGGNVKD